MAPGILTTFVDAPVQRLRNLVIQYAIRVHSEILYQDRDAPPHQMTVPVIEGHRPAKNIVVLLNQETSSLDVGTQFPDLRNHR